MRNVDESQSLETRHSAALNVIETLNFLFRCQQRWVRSYCVIVDQTKRVHVNKAHLMMKLNPKGMRENLWYPASSPFRMQTKLRWAWWRLNHFHLLIRFLENRIGTQSRNYFYLESLSNLSKTTSDVCLMKSSAPRASPEWECNQKLSSTQLLWKDEFDKALDYLQRRRKLFRLR